MTDIKEFIKIASDKYNLSLPDNDINVIRFIAYCIHSGYNDGYHNGFKDLKEEAEKVNGIHTINSKCSKCKNGAVVVGCALNAEPDSPYCHKHCEPYSSSLII
jgi:hypothetical protein